MDVLRLSNEIQEAQLSRKPRNAGQTAKAVAERNSMTMRCYSLEIDKELKIYFFTGLMLQRTRYCKAVDQAFQLGQRLHTLQR